MRLGTPMTVPCFLFFSLLFRVWISKKGFWLFDFLFCVWVLKWVLKVVFGLKREGKEGNFGFSGFFRTPPCRRRLSAPVSGGRHGGRWPESGIHGVFWKIFWMFFVFMKNTKNISEKIWKMVLIGFERWASNGFCFLPKCVLYRHSMGYLPLKPLRPRIFVSEIL